MYADIELEPNFV